MPKHTSGLINRTHTYTSNNISRSEIRLTPALELFKSYLSACDFFCVFIAYLIEYKR